MCVPLYRASNSTSPQADRWPSCCCRHLGIFFKAEQSLIIIHVRDWYACGSLGRDVRVLHLIRLSHRNDGGSPGRHASDVNLLLLSMCSFLRDVGRWRMPPNMPAQDIISKSLRPGGSECSLAAVADGSSTFMEVPTCGFGSPSS
jgi:hypothetical protein